MEYFKVKSQKSCICFIKVINIKTPLMFTKTSKGANLMILLDKTNHKI